MDEILSVEELTEAAKDEQYSEFTDYSVCDDYVVATLEENEHLQDWLAITESEYQEQETEYAEVDVDPIKIEVDLDEIVSADELTELTDYLKVDETKAENEDFVFSEELASEIAAVEKELEVEDEDIDYQDTYP